MQNSKMYLSVGVYICLLPNFMELFLQHLKSNLHEVLLNKLLLCSHLQLFFISFPLSSVELFAPLILVSGAFSEPSETFSPKATVNFLSWH